MRNHSPRRITAALFAVLTIWINSVTAHSTDLKDAVLSVKSFSFSTRLVQWELGDFFFAADGLTAPAMLALRESPVLLQAYGNIQNAALEEPAQAADPAPVEESHGTEDPPPTLTSQTPRPDPGWLDNGVPSQTVEPKSGSGFTVVNGVKIKNASDKLLDSEALSGSDFAARLQPDAPQVLIVHTHGSEAYTPPQGTTYSSTGNYRTNDPAGSVVGVGDEVAAVLSGYGISVLHDRTLYDDPLYEGAYERAAEGIRAYLEKYPSLTFVLDIHRDAVQDSTGQQYKLVTREDPHTAQISLIMGSNHEGWEENLKLAVALSQQATVLSPTIMRPITLRNSNYNQHLTSGSLLVEIGTAGNSPAEALKAGQILAEAFAKTVLMHQEKAGS